LKRQQRDVTATASLHDIMIEAREAAEWPPP
jgi:hypothetical protein